MYIAVDVGGTNTRVAGAQSLESPVFTGEPLRRRTLPSYEANIQFVIDAAKQIAIGHPITALGVGAPGTPDEQKTHFVAVNNLPHWEGQPIVGPLSEALNCPVYYDNDVVAAATGEAYFGQTRGDFHYITWGTGIGGAAVDINSHVPVITKLKREYLDEWEVGCGGTNLTKRLGSSLEELSAEQWQPIIERFLDHARRYIELYKPAAIVLGGGLAARHAKSIGDSGRSWGIPLQVSEFGANSGLVGGLALIKQRTAE